MDGWDWLSASELVAECKFTALRYTGVNWSSSFIFIKFGRESVDERGASVWTGRLCSENSDRVKKEKKGSRSLWVSGYSLLAVNGEASARVLCACVCARTTASLSLFSLHLAIKLLGAASSCVNNAQQGFPRARGGPLSPSPQKQTILYFSCHFQFLADRTKLHAYACEFISDW
jgi:hypothetical protein